MTNRNLMFWLKTVIALDFPFSLWVVYVKELLAVQSWKQVHENICWSSHSLIGKQQQQHEGNLIISDCVKTQGRKVNEV